MGYTDSPAGRITALVEPLITGHGFELVSLEAKRISKGYLIRIFVDREPAVTIDDCVFLSQGLRRILDLKAEDFLPDYTLEVSSPGLDRPLVKEQDFIRFKGSRARVTCQDAAGVKRTLEGTISDYVESVLILAAAQGEMRIPYREIIQARLHPTDEEIWAKGSAGNK